MKVSVVCPTYGRIPFLNRMLASFLSQDYDDKQLIIVNDDENIELKCSYNNVIVINLNHKLLLPQKRNIGNGASYSDLLMPFDDDDIFLPQRISNHVKKHQDNPDIGYYRNISSYIIYDGKFDKATTGPSACSYLRSTYHQVGGYAHFEHLGEDREFVDKIDNKIEERNELTLDYIYNFSGVNYHSSCINNLAIEQVAYQQLVDLNLLNKKHYIEPDFQEFEKFVNLDSLYQKNQQPIDTDHQTPYKINY